MSIRKRVSLMLVIVFLINFAGIFIFSLLLLPSGVNQQVASMKEQVNKTVQSIILQLEKSDNFHESVDESVIGDGMLIYIEDLDGNIVYTYPDKNAPSTINIDNNLYITASEKFLSTNSNGQQIYFIKGAVAMSSKFSLKKIPPFMSLYLERMLFFEIVVFTVAMVIIIISIRRIILLPLEKLANSIRGYNKNIHIAKNDEKNELSSLTKDFDALTGALTEEENKQTRIIASVSHDIKTPLTSIMGYAEQLKKEDISVERKTKYVNTIYEKSIAIKRMIEGLDDYLTYNDKADSSEKMVVPVKQLLTAVDSYYSDDLDRENCVFTIEDKTSDAVIIINKADMLRVFGNIISNSTKHKSDDLLKIHIEVSQVNDEIVFKVSDNGTGVEKWQFKKIFEPLYTTDESRSKSVSGLGLSICKDIIEAHQGRIFAEKSIFDTGLTITFIIPKANKK